MTRRYLRTLPPAEAVRQMLEHIRPIEDEEVLPVYQCKGRMTSRPVYALFSNPRFICSAMDGFATAHERTLDADLTRPLSLTRDVNAIRVNTGDPLPSGTDAVIMREDVEESPEAITIRKPVYLWQNVRMVGEDVIEGDMLLPSNQKVGTLDIGVLISGGVQEIHVRRLPRIIIIPTGQELIDIFGKDPDDASYASGLVDFNSYTLWKLAEGIGYEATRYNITRNYEELKEIIEESVDTYDVIAVNAGTSAGSEDFTESIINELGTLIFHGVAMMPGKPTMLGMIRGKPIIGIPGYPVSAVISFNTFLEPLFERLSRSRRFERSLPCVLPYQIPSRIGVEEILRVNLGERDGIYYAFPLARGASVFSSMVKADALVRVPANIEGYGEGEEVRCTLLRDEEEIKGRAHIVGSHDLCLDILRDMMRVRHPPWDLISTHVGSLSGITAFERGIDQLCTVHILDEDEGTYNIPVLKRYLPHRKWTLIHITRRQQGLLVGRNNPKGINGIEDLARQDVRFVNRQIGSGTRILLDSMLRRQGIEKKAINGYDREESSHTAVGVLVKESIADVGVGIYAVARLFSLGFIPLAEEEYDLLVAREFMGDKRFELLEELLASVEFQERLEAIGGYDTRDRGKIKYVHD
jgi:putative molybdopterin biosynthesis protein